MSAIAALFPLLTFGSDVMSVNWLPSLIGPLGLAAQEPAGERGFDNPNGMVPASPTLPPPANFVLEDPWN